MKLEQARVIVDSVLSGASGPVSVFVADTHGELVAAVTMDGAAPDTRVIARLLASNRRVMCAAPTYLAEHGEPKVPSDLARHNCIGIHEGDESYGIWRLINTHRQTQVLPPETVKTRGDLSTNDGEIAVSWALEGQGIVMRSEWDVAHHLRDGRLVEVLPQYRMPDADIYAIYPQRHQLSARVRAFVDFMAATLLQIDADAEG